jgi:UDP-GlcNAc:undecaprenyl-phosphate GlcNAc-1-phosphate transferase
MFFPFLIAFSASLFLIRLLIKYAPHMGLEDIPNARSVHKNATPLGAGIGIFIAFFFALFFSDSHFFANYPLSLFAFVIVFLIGLLDDYRGASPRTKFIVIFIATTLCYLEGIGIHSLGPFFGFDLALGWLALPFTLFAVSGFTNALNLIDGLDGLAGTISMIILAVMFYIGFENGDAFIMNVSALLFAAIAAFLFFNWNPARIFLGDSGSLTIGFLISIVSIKALDYVHPTLILFLAQIPILDTLIVMIRRKRHGRSAFEADKTHLHHILLDFFNGNVKRTVTSLVMLQTVSSLTGLFYLYNVEQTLVLLLFIVNLVLLYIFSSSMLENQRRMTRLKANLRALKKLQKDNTVSQTDQA